MSDASPRSLSPLWFLLLLPVGLGLGWLAGQLPVEAAPPAPVRVQAAVASTSAETPTTIRPDAPVATSESAEAPPAETPAEAKPAPVLSQWTTYENALAESGRTGKPILLDFNADWCPPCQALKRELFESGASGQAVQLAVIPVSIVDRQRESGSNSRETESLQNRYGISAFPTLVVFHPGTGRMQQARGYGGAERTRQWIEQAAAAVK